MDFAKVHPRFADVLFGMRYDRPQRSAEIDALLASKVPVPVIDLTNDDDDELPAGIMRRPRGIIDLTSDEDQSAPSLDDSQSSITTLSPPTPVPESSSSDLAAYLSKKRNYSWIQQGRSSLGLQGSMGMLEHPAKRARRMEAAREAGQQLEESKEPNDIFWQRQAAGLQTNPIYKEGSGWELPEPEPTKQEKKRRGTKKPRVPKLDTDNVKVAKPKAAPKKRRGKGKIAPESSKTIEQDEALSQVGTVVESAPLELPLFLVEEPVPAEAGGDLEIVDSTSTSAEDDLFDGSDAGAEEDLDDMVAAFEEEYQKQEAEQIGEEDLDDMVAAFEEEYQRQDAEQMAEEETAGELEEKETATELEEEQPVDDDDDAEEDDWNAAFEEEFSREDAEEAEQAAAQEDEQPSNYDRYAYAYKPEEEWSEEE